MVALSIADINKFALTPESLWRTHFPITPSNTTSIDPPTRGLFVGGAGDIVITDLDGNDATYTVPAGSFIRVLATKVKATGTTATNIIGGR